MKDEILHALSEEIQEQDYCIVSYYTELACGADPYEKAKNLAVGQTVGTWISVPGITEEMRRHHMGKVVNIFDLNADDLVRDFREEKKKYIFQIAYPVANFENRLPLFLTTILGNDASTSIQAKIIDLHFPGKMVESFPGPAWGIRGIRSLCGEKERPLLLNMIKPCIGFSPRQGAALFYETALGGIDFIKDDELLGNLSFCPLEERVREYTKAARAAFEITGKETIYIPNITDHVANLVENAKRAVDAGAKMIMVNFAAAGIGTLQMLREQVTVPIMGHYAGAGPFYEGACSGMASSLVLGKLPRLAGADIVMINTPYGGYPLKRSSYLRTVHELSLSLGNIKPALPSCGGGVNPKMAYRLIEDLGTDIMLAPGGAVQGHPMGAKAGVKAMLDAVQAKMEGRTLEEAMETSGELRAASRVWERQEETA